MGTITPDGLLAWVEQVCNDGSSELTVRDCFRRVASVGKRTSEVEGTLGGVATVGNAVRIRPWVGHIQIVGHKPTETRV